LHKNEVALKNLKINLIFVFAIYNKK